MLDENQQEELTADAAQVYSLGQSVDEFINLMQEKWYNVSKYILTLVFKAVRSTNDFIKEGA